jgi:hypothetical protein
MPPVTHTRPVPGYRYELAVDERPRRAFSSVNVRFEDKEIFDILQGHLTALRGRALPHWDVFNVLLAEWLDAHAGELPTSLRRPAASSILDARGPLRGSRRG